MSDTMLDIPIKEILVHPDQPRIEEKDIEILAASIKEVGLIEPLGVATIINRDNGDLAYMVISGHRRLAALKLLKASTVPCHVVFEAITQEKYSDTMGSLMAANTVREDFTLIEKAAGYQKMLDLGLSIETIASATGDEPVLVEKMTSSAAKLTPTVHTYLEKDRALTLTELEGISLFENDESKTEQLLEALQDGHFEHKLAAFKKDKRIAENVAEVKQMLIEHNIKIVDKPSWDEKKIFSLHTIDMTEDEHRTCPGHAAWISVNYEERASAVFCCLDPLTHHNYKARVMGAAEQKNIDEKRAGLKFKKDMIAPTEVRRQWILDKFKAGTPWKKEWEFIAHALAYRNSSTKDIAYELANVKRKPDEDWTAAFIGKDEKRSHRIALALIIAALDEETRLSMGTTHFRATHVPHYLRFLMTNGYVLSPHEEKFLVV